MDYNPFKKSISELNDTEVDQGKLLVAEPFMADPNFKRAVVLITEYNEKGVVGFVLNHPMGFNIKDVIRDFPDFKGPLFEGGPVDGQILFFIHSKGDLIDDSIKISTDLYWSGDLDKLKLLIIEQKINPSEIKFFLGYSGWDIQQLEQELKNNSWFVRDATPEIVFNKNEDLWKSVVENSPGEISVMANFPVDPGMN